MNFHEWILVHKHDLILMGISSIFTIFIIMIVIGKQKLTWLVTELIKMYSAAQKSYFSKKRIESGFAYIIFQYGMLFWLTKCNTATDYGAWAIIEATVSGWTVNQIQKEKMTNLTGNNNVLDNVKEDTINNPQ